MSSSSRALAPTRADFFVEVVGLRAYLALWVGIGHGLQLAGYMRGGNPLTALLLRGEAAVAVFMILSGFVIANLLTRKQEGYLPYLVRRFFRLFPAYLVCSVAGFLVLDSWVSYMYEVPWQSAPRWDRYTAHVETIQRESRDRFWPHALAHLFMLHGAVPAQVLPKASMTFLPASWSISLEWQFYLVAPLVIASLRSTARTVLLSVCVGSAFVLYKHGLLGAYQGPTTLAAASGYFLVGVASRLFLERLRALRFSPLAASALAILATVLLSADPLPLAIWGIFYSYLTWSEHASATGALYKKLTTNRLALAIGEASYSLYLIHRPIQVLFAWLALSFVRGSQPFMAALSLVALGCAVLVSMPMYRLLEKPFERIGYRIARALGARASGANPTTIGVAVHVSESRPA